MSIECEDFAHKRASGKTTPLANQLIIIPQMGCSACCSQPVQARAELKIKTAKKEESSQFREIKEAFVSPRERTARAQVRDFERNGPLKQND